MAPLVHPAFLAKKLCECHHWLPYLTDRPPIYYQVFWSQNATQSWPSNSISIILVKALAVPSLTSLAYQSTASFHRSPCFHFCFPNDNSPQSSQWTSLKTQTSAMSKSWSKLQMDPKTNQTKILSMALKAWFISCIPHSSPATLPFLLFFKYGKGTHLSHCFELEFCSCLSLR